MSIKISSKLHIQGCQQRLGKHQLTFSSPKKPKDILESPTEKKTSCCSWLVNAMRRFVQWLLSCSCFKTKAKTPRIETPQPSTKPQVAPLFPKAKTQKLKSHPISAFERVFKVFWALGTDWWKQLYDGKYQSEEWGPRVFDEGLHDGTKEPGFYESAKAACELVSSPEHLMAPPSVKLYTDIHKTACKHFKGKSTATLIADDQIGQFKLSKGTKCEGNFCSFHAALPDGEEIREQYREAERYTDGSGIETYGEDTSCEPLWLHTIRFPDLTVAQLVENYKRHKAWIDDFIPKTVEKVQKLQEYINKRSEQLGVKPIATFQFVGLGNYILQYNCHSEETLEKVVAALFAEYNKNIANAKSQREKLILIADLYQMLDWLHPFPDGQGRTDLILLMKELCRHGFTPAILHDPYVSTFCTLEEWVAYLEDGMKRWQEEEAEKRKSLSAAVKA